MKNPFRITKLEDNFIGVVSRQSELIAYCHIELKDKKTIIKRVYATGNGDGLLFLLNHLKEKAYENELFMYHSSLFELSVNSFSKFKSINWIQVIE